METKLQKGFTLNGKKITPMAIMSYFWAIWQQSDEYFGEIIAPDWDRNDAMYRDRFDQPVKQRWQQEVTMPIVDQLVTRITQFFTRILVNTHEDFFTVKHDNKQKQQAYKELVKSILRDNKFAEEVFPTALSNAWLNALFITKTHFISEIETFPLLNADNELEYTEEVKSKVKIEVVAPRNMRLDPYGDQYTIEIVDRIPLNTFMDMARTNGWVNADKVKHDSLYATMASADGKYSKETTMESNHLPLVDLYYVYTKALTDESGETLCKDVCFIIANKDYVLDLKYNMGVNGSTPYTVHNPMLDVYGRYGRPYISKLRSLIKQYMNAVNLAMDAGVLAALGTHEINTEAMHNQTAHTVTSDIDPGRLLPKRGEAKLLESTYPPNGALQAILQMIYFLDQQIQNHSYQTEFFDGQNTSRGRKTATEVNTKVQQTNTFFTDIATQIENYSIQPTVEKALHTYLLHMDDTMIKDLSVNISDENIRGYLLGLSYADRLQDIRNLQIEVKGMSGKIQLQNNFSKVLQLLSVLGNFGATQGLTATKLIEKGFEVVDDTPDEFYDMEVLTQVMSSMQQPQPPQATGMPGQNAGGMEQPPAAQVSRQVADQAPAAGV